METKTATIQMRVLPSVKDKALEMAEKEGYSLSRYIEELILRDYNGTVPDRLKRKAYDEIFNREVDQKVREIAEDMDIDIDDVNVLMAAPLELMAMPTIISTDTVILRREEEIIKQVLEKVKI